MTGDREADAPGTGVAPLTAADVAAITAATGRGDVALFPSDGVYGLAADPDDADAVARIAALKGRDPAKPSAVMCWSVDDALALLDGVPAAVVAAVAALLPGPVGVLVPNPSHRFAAVLGDDPGTLGLRVPRLLEPARGAPVVQTSANLAGGPDPATFDAVPETVRTGCGLLLDRGVLPGTPSTLVDLRGLADGRGWRVVREGAVPTSSVARLLAG